MENNSLGGHANEIPRYNDRTQFEMMLHSIPGGVICVRDTADYNVIFANSVFLRALGYDSLEDYIASTDGKHINSVHPEDRKAIFEDVERCARAETDSYLFRGLKKDGSTIWLRESNRPVIAPDGSRALICVGNNVTDAVREREEYKAIFSHIPGAVCHYVLKDNRLSPVFISDGLARIVGLTKEQAAARIDEDSAYHVHPEDRHCIFDAFKRFLNGEKRVVDIYRMLNESTGKYTWIKNEGICVSRGNGSYDIYASYLSVDEDVAVRGELEAKTRQLQTIVDTAMLLRSGRDFSIEINEMLQRVREYFSAARAYIFSFDFEQGTTTNTFEACGEVVSEERQKLQNLPIDTVGFWLKEFKTKEFIHISIDSIPADDESRSLERQVLTQQGIGELFSAPLYRDGEIVGFVGVDDPRRNQDDAQVLSLLSGLIADELTKHTIQSKLQEYEAEMQYMLKRVPGAIAKYAVSRNGVKLLFLSEGYKELTGYSPAEEMEALSGNVLANVHPSDAPEMAAKIKEMCAATSSYYEHTFRLRCKDGRYKWVRLQGTNEGMVDGKVVFYAVYTDMTKDIESSQKEKRLREALEKAGEQNQALIQNIPGAFIVFDIIDGKRRMSYISDGIIGLLGYSSEETKEKFGADPDKAIHPDDVKSIEIISAAVKEKTSFQCDYRLRRKDGTWQWVNVNGSVVGTKDKSQLYAIYTDISKTKAAEEQLRLSRADLAAAIQNSSMGYWEYYPEERALVYGKAYYEGGQDETTVLKLDNNNDDGFVFPEDYEVFLELHKAIDRGEDAVSAQVRILKNGEYRWELIKYTAIKDEQGKTIKAICTSQDISELKKAQTSYQREIEQRKLLDRGVVASAAINLTKDTVTIFSADDPEKEQGSAETKLEDALKTVTRCISSEEERQSYLALHSRENLLKSYDEGTDFLSMDYRRRDENRQMAWMRSSVKLLKEPTSGDIVAVQRTSNINDEKIIKEITAATLRLDYQTIIYLDGGTGTFIRFSKTNDAENPLNPQYGGDFWEYIKSYTEKNVFEDDKERVARFTERDYIFSRLERDGEISFVYKLSLQDKSASVRMRIDYLDRENRLVMITVTDVTELIRIEQERNAKLEQALSAADKANAAKSDFLSRMSHDMRTPLNAVISMTDFALEEPGVPEKALEYLENVKASGKYLLSLINDILSMSKIESGQLRITCAPTTTGDLVHFIRSIIQERAKEKDIEFSVSVSDNTKMAFMADVAHVSQVLVNLLSNAVKYTPRGGKVSLKVEALPDMAGNVTHIYTVSDNGIGMSEDYQSRMYEPFTQEGRSTGGHENGTGLGLSIVKNLVAQMKGGISCSSAVGQGTVFTVTMCYEMVELERVRKKAFPAPSDVRHAKGEMILLAEDHPMNVLVARRLLEKQGYTVEVAEDGEVAVDMFSGSKPGYYKAILMTSACRKWTDLRQQEP